ncbi:MAG: hypothetical protein H5T34_04260 [Candidatus Methanomethyliales bacterium]|nr:hypothetical protein [Candidatus Methanomethylicales archaeon]
MVQKELASQRKTPENRSTTHIRVKKSVKFELEKWMRRHHCKTFSQAIKKLLSEVTA